MGFCPIGVGFLNAFPLDQIYRARQKGRPVAGRGFSRAEVGKIFPFALTDSLGTALYNQPTFAALPSPLDCEEVRVPRRSCLG